MPYKDAAKQRVYQREWAKRRQAARRAEALLLLGGDSPGCERCGETDQSVLQFDHIDPADKLFCIIRGYSRRYSDWLAELEKCQLLCEECHDKKSVAEGDYTWRHGWSTM
jgi:5-methylcytosine-specific restriction endonuclease McrA